MNICFQKGKPVAQQCYLLMFCCFHKPHHILGYLDDDHTCGRAIVMLWVSCELNLNSEEMLSSPSLCCTSLKTDNNRVERSLFTLEIHANILALWSSLTWTVVSSLPHFIFVSYKNESNVKCVWGKSIKYLVTTLLKQALMILKCNWCHHLL